MPPSLTSNRSMFWRIVRRLITAHRGRLFVILLALSAGATISAALLNLQVDAKRRLTTEFRAFGPQVAIVPRDFSRENTFGEFILPRVPEIYEGNQVVRVGILSLVATVYHHAASSEQPPNPISIVVVGYTGGVQQEMLERFSHGPRALPYCNLGVKTAAALNVREGDELILRNGQQRATCFVSSVLNYGGEQDSQISVYIKTAQGLASLPGRLASIQVVTPAAPASINRLVTYLTQQFPDLDVRPIRQFTEAQAKIYSRISGLLNFTVALVLVLTGLCVMAAMTNVAMERRNDVGLMKAIGGARRRVLRLFLAEATLLGLAGGIIGAAAGIALSMYLGKAVFGLAARPRLIVYPVSVALTLIVAIFSAYPLRHLASIRPASVFRGEA